MRHASCAALLVVAGLIASSALLVASTIPARAQTLDDQERCASQAEKAFREWERDNKTGPLAGFSKPLSSDYESHFNTKMKKCLILIESTDSVTGTGNTSNSALLMDAFERHVYANYSWVSSQTKKYWEVKPLMCDLIPAAQPKKNCADRDEFDAFVAGVWSKYWSEASISSIANLIALITVPVPHRRPG
jgi:hypothetical protein